MLTISEEKTLIELLNKLEPTMSAEVFNAVIDKFVLPAIETVVLRENNGEVEMLMTQRPDYDKFWPLEWHNPGSVVRASDYISEDDSEFEKVFTRVQAKEIKTKFSTDPIFAGYKFYRTKRCPLLCMVYICEIEGESTEGKFFNIKNLPENHIKDQIPVWDIAWKKFKEIKNLD